MAGIPDGELLIAGGPDASELSADSEASRLLDLATELGVGHQVRLCGAVSRGAMPAMLRSADVVACTPWYEPFGIVPVEAHGVWGAGCLLPLSAACSIPSWTASPACWSHQKTRRRAQEHSIQC